MRKGQHSSLGVVLVLFGAVSFGVHSTLVKELLFWGSNPAQILFYEFALATLALGVIWLGLGRSFRGIRPREIGRVLFWGLIGAAGTGLSLYAAVQRIPVALAIVLLFNYVPWVFFLEWTILKIRPTRKRWIALAMILAGTLLATDLLGVSWRGLDAEGVVLGIASGLCYGTLIFGTRGLGAIGTPLDRSLLICGTAGAIFLAGGMFAPAYVFVPPEPLGRFAAVAVVVTVLGQVIPLLSFSKAIPMVGGSLSAIIASVELPMACLAAFLLLGERLHFSQILGVCLITLAIVVANWPGRNESVARAVPDGSGNITQ